MLIISSVIAAPSPNILVGNGCSPNFFYKFTPTVLAIYVKRKNETSQKQGPKA